MKNSIKRLFLPFAALLVVSCSDMVLCEKESNQTSSLVSNKIGTYKVCIAGSASRQMLPSDWYKFNDTAALSDLVYVLSGSCSSPDITGLDPSFLQINQTYTYEQLSSSETTFDAYTGTWTLTLTAYQKNAEGSADTAKPCLRASDTFTLGTVNSIVFNLLPVYEDTEASGEVNITFKYIPTDELTEVTFGLYEESDGSYTPLTGLTDSEGYDAVTRPSVSGALGYASLNFTRESVKAGNDYYFCVFFYSGSGSDKVMSGSFCDRLTVDGGNKTERTITTSYKGIINTSAKDPLRASVVTDFTDFGDSEEGSASSFTAYFTWTDTSDNEQGYQLVLTDITDADNPVDYILTGSNTGESDSSSTVKVSSGSLKAGSKSCTVTGIPTGKKYKAVIASYNYLDKKDDDGKYTSYTQVFEESNQSLSLSVINGTQTQSTDSEFGVYTVTYNLSGGVVPVTDSDGNTFVYGTKYVKGYKYNETEAYITSVDYTDDTKTFRGWSESESSSEAISDTNVKFDGNTQLWALWTDSTP